MRSMCLDSGQSSALFLAADLPTPRVKGPRLLQRAKARRDLAEKLEASQNSPPQSPHPIRSSGNQTRVIPFILGLLSALSRTRIRRKRCGRQ